MIKIDWNEYKEFKRYDNKNESFNILLDFMKSYYNMTSPNDMFEIFADDELACMMLEKRDIKTPEDLESYIYNRKI